MQTSIHGKDKECSTAEHGEGQYPVIKHDGKEYEEECICITESLCYTAEINTMS